MGTVYKSKVDFWLICLILVLLLITVVPVMIWAFSWIAVVISVALLIFIFYFLFSFEYVIQGDELNIKCGIFSNDKVDIKRITKVVPTNSMLSTPAASMDRIALYLTKQRSPVIISPKNKKEFIERLKSINNNIEVDSMQF